jgi:hypothetical protein
MLLPALLFLLGEAEPASAAAAAAPLLLLLLLLSVPSSAKMLGPCRREAPGVGGRADMCLCHFCWAASAANSGCSFRSTCWLPAADPLEVLLLLLLLLLLLALLGLACTLALPAAAGAALAAGSATSGASSANMLWCCSSEAPGVGGRADMCCCHCC